MSAIVILTIGGYFPDPVVSYGAKYSNDHKKLIGFLLLASLARWPKFNSCSSLLKRKKYLAAVLHITVSNLTDIWLAAIGVCSSLLRA